MFCNQCGTQLPDNASFCAMCGQKQVEVPEPASVSGGKKSYKKLLIAVIAAILVLAIGIGAFATSGFGLFLKKASNPFAAAYDGIFGLLELNSFRFNLYGSYDGDVASADGYIKFGKDFDDTVLYIEANVDGDTGTIALYDGIYYVSSYGYTYAYDVKNILDEAMRYNNQISFGIEDINSLYDGEHLSRKKIVDYWISGSYLKENGLSRDESEVLRIFNNPARKQAWNLFEDLLYKGCSDKDMKEDMFSDFDEYNRDGNTVYDFTIDFYGSIKAAIDYISDNYKNYSELRKAADGIIDYAKSQGSDEVQSFSAGLRIFRDMILSRLAYAPVQSADVKLSVNGKGVLQEFEISVGQFNGSIVISDQNKVEVNTRKLDDLKRNARRYD